MDSRSIVPLDAVLGNAGIAAASMNAGPLEIRFQAGNEAGTPLVVIANLAPPTNPFWFNRVVPEFASAVPPVMRPPETTCTGSRVFAVSAIASKRGAETVGAFSVVPQAYPAFSPA